MRQLGAPVPCPPVSAGLTWHAGWWLRAWALLDGLCEPVPHLAVALQWEGEAGGGDLGGGP